MDVDCGQRWVAHDRVHGLEKEIREEVRRDLARHLEAIDSALGQLERERGQFVPRNLYDERHEALRGELGRSFSMLRENLAELNEARSNLEGRLWAIGVIWTVLTLVLNLGLHFWSVGRAG